MSRSYKKTPILKESIYGSNKIRKKAANQYVRTILNDCSYEIANGNAYKKIYSRGHQYIFDWRAIRTKKEWIEKYKRETNPYDAQNYYLGATHIYQNEKVALFEWKKRYRNK